MLFNLYRFWWTHSTFFTNSGDVKFGPIRIMSFKLLVNEIGELKIIYPWSLGATMWLHLDNVLDCYITCSWMAPLRGPDFMSSARTNMFMLKWLMTRTMHPGCCIHSFQRNPWDHWGYGRPYSCKSLFYRSMDHSLDISLVGCVNPNKHLMMVPIKFPSFVLCLVDNWKGSNAFSMCVLDTT